MCRGSFQFFCIRIIKNPSLFRLMNPFNFFFDPINANIRTCHGYIRACNEYITTCHGYITMCNVLLRTCHGHIRRCHGYITTCNVILRTCHGHIRRCHGYITGSNISLNDSKKRFFYPVKPLGVPFSTVSSVG